MKNCLNCHFLSKYILIPGNPDFSHFTWDDEEREQAKTKRDFVPACKRGVWSQGIDSSIREQKLVEYVSMDRGESCFFMEHQKGMSFPAAIELQSKQQQIQVSRKSTIMTAIGIATAAVFSVLNFIAKFF